MIKNYVASRFWLLILLAAIIIITTIWLLASNLNTPSVSSFDICTNETWVELPRGNLAVIQNIGPDSVHDIAGAQPIWGENVEPSSSTILVRSFTVPDHASNISGTITFIADDGVTLFLNSEEVGNYDAQVWPPPVTFQLTNLQSGPNQFRAEVYNRPSLAWFEACASIMYAVATSD